eukprot:6539232-Heterocapsa_arctica.AAC.1
MYVSVALWLKPWLKPLAQDLARRRGVRSHVLFALSAFAATPGPGAIAVRSSPHSRYLPACTEASRLLSPCCNPAAP